jgi:hypothetical protein
MEQCRVEGATCNCRAEWHYVLKRVGPRKTVDIIVDIPEKVAGFCVILAF